MEMRKVTGRTATSGVIKHKPCVMTHLGVPRRREITELSSGRGTMPAGDGKDEMRGHRKGRDYFDIGGDREKEGKTQHAPITD